MLSSNSFPLYLHRVAKSYSKSSVRRTFAPRTKSHMSVTILDVAKAAGVSTATVSNVLNKTGKVGRKTRQLVLSTVKRLGYIPNLHARHLASRDSRTLGIIVSDIENPFFPEVIKSFEDRARQLGYDAI